MISGEDIREARELAGMNQKELADRVGASERTIGNWERGASLPRNKEAKLRDVLSPWIDKQRSALESVSSVELLAEIAKRFVKAEELDLLRRQEAAEHLPRPTRAEEAHKHEVSIRFLEQAAEMERQHPGTVGDLEQLEARLADQRLAVAAEQGEIEPDDQPSPDDD